MNLRWMKTDDCEVLSPSSESRPGPLKATCKTVFKQGMLSGKVGDPD